MEDMLRVFGKETDHLILLKFAGFADAYLPDCKDFRH